MKLGALIQALEVARARYGADIDAAIVDADSGLIMRVREVEFSRVNKRDLVLMKGEGYRSPLGYSDINVEAFDTIAMIEFKVED